MSCHCMAQGFCAMTRIVELGSPRKTKILARGYPGQSSPATRVRGFGPALSPPRLMLKSRPACHRSETQSAMT
jgi:hypothetical protein